MLKGKRAASVLTEHPSTPPSMTPAEVGQSHGDGPEGLEQRLVPLNFVRVNAGEADIMISFETGGTVVLPGFCLLLQRKNISSTFSSYNV